MKRVLLIALIAVTMIGLFAANQTRLLAKGTPVAASISASETMQTANGLYEEGQFSQAAQAYQHLVDQGFVDGALFYNLGNAYYKLDRMDEARDAWTKALELDPGNEKARRNLERIGKDND